MCQYGTALGRTKVAELALAEFTVHMFAFVVLLDPQFQAVWTGHRPAFPLVGGPDLL